MDTSDHGLLHCFKHAGVGCEWYDMYPDCVGVVSLHCQLDLNMLGILSLPTHTHLKNCSQVNVEN
jgi:hypothetical protein